MESSYDKKQCAITETAAQEKASDDTEDRPSDPTAFSGKMSAGSVMMRPDHDCWQKNAMLNNPNAQATGTCGTRITTGMNSALMPRASFREKSSDFPRLSSTLENHPPRKLPTPEAA